MKAFIFAVRFSIVYFCLTSRGSLVRIQHYPLIRALV